MDAGINPGTEQGRYELHGMMVATLAQAKARRVADLTVQDLFDAWIEDGVRRNDRNPALNRLFGADMLPKPSAIAIKDLPSDMRVVLRALVDRHIGRMQ